MSAQADWAAFTSISYQLIMLDSRAGVILLHRTNRTIILVSLVKSLVLALYI